MVKVIVGTILKLAILLAISCQWLGNGYTSAKADKEVHNINDNLTITLSKGSKYRLIEQANTSITKLELEGAALLKHKEGTQEHLLVQTSHFNIELRGGKGFIADKKGITAQVQLIDGTATVETVSNGAAVLLSKGQKVDLHENGTMATVKMLRLIEQGWYYDNYEWETTQLRSVIQDLVMMYGHRINLDPEIMNCLITLSIKPDNDVESVLQKIAKTFGAQVLQEKTIYSLRGGSCKS